MDREGREYVHVLFIVMAGRSTGVVVLTDMIATDLYPLACTGVVAAR